MEVPPGCGSYRDKRGTEYMLGLWKGSVFMPEIPCPVQPAINRSFGIIDAITFKKYKCQPPVTFRLQRFSFVHFSFCGVCKKKSAPGARKPEQCVVIVRLV